MEGGVLQYSGFREQRQKFLEKAERMGCDSVIGDVDRRKGVEEGKKILAKRYIL